MREFSFSNKSWHWRLATKYGPLPKWQETYDGDICSYARVVAKGALHALLITIVLAIMSVSFADFLIWAWVSITIGWVDIRPIGLIAPALSGIIGFFFLYLYCDVKLSNYLTKRKVEKLLEHSDDGKHASFIRVFFKKLREKTCFMIKVS